MINVIFKKKDNYLVSFNINGHAEYDYEGYDIVCSAISALCITFANGITEVVKVNAKISEHDGYVDLNLDNQTREQIKRCQVLMETMLLGIKCIEDSYGDYIKLEVEEVQ
ncbi:hypothetical protein SAMN02745134_00742 [Clostridium acidisoli DSM 12555]|uniref:Ribosomal processing cysteine protease Prp n=1 Tax=Clostridium acidisoli DSM 12555 TaxID=1121291 RepID=A0A1W1X5E2_9CLOT|nr:ribosomal-processing cysteine protease Prp [Clostridium acidisoli]SMC19060.1 hypothetical protein SAMN02745134_00742 [Clostridium acidisoli DSM 12555]